MRHQYTPCYSTAHHRADVRPTLLSSALAVALCAPTFAFAQDTAGGGGRKPLMRYK